MKNKRKTLVCALALNALQGKLSPVPDGMGESILDLFPDMGGIQLAEPSKEILKKALRFCEKGSRVSHIIVNRIDGDIHISLLIDTPDDPITSNTDLLGKPVLAYVYNNSCPYCSELGSIWLEQRKDRNIYRIG